MFRFFSKMRYKLAEEYRVSKYLRYAVGEIFLVVTGIIIALQLNNWNEERKTHNAELQLYQTLLEDIDNEYSNLGYDKMHFTRYQDFYYHLMEENKGNEGYSEFQHYNYLSWGHRYEAFINEKYNASMSMITNERIHRWLKNYKRVEKDTEDAIDGWNAFHLQTIRPFLRKYGINDAEELYNDRTYGYSELESRVTHINHSRLQEQFGTLEFEQLMADLRIETSWAFQNIVWLMELNREFEAVLKEELKLANQELTINDSPPELPLEIAFHDGYTIEEIVEIIKNEEDNPGYKIDRPSINLLGYVLLQKDSIQDAVKIFKLNTELNPHWNTFDGYGECLLALGDIENALKAYQKSLELNPDNSNAKEVLEKYLD